MISPGVFFIFSKILIWFGEIKNSLCHTPSYELYIIWLSFMVQMCKMIISPDAFFFFILKKKAHGVIILHFLGYEGANRAKSSPKWKKICLLHSISQELYIIWLSFMV